MDDKEAIEEAHGLWELRVAELVGLVSARASRKKLRAALAEERAAFLHWQCVSNTATSRAVAPQASR